MSSGTDRRARFLSRAILVCTLAALPAAAQTAPPVEANVVDSKPRWAAADATPVGKDWIQLKSSEWLNGKLFGMYDNELEFDSSEMDLRTFDWEDVHEVRTAQEMEVGRIDDQIASGKLVIDRTTVRVIAADGAVQEFPRAEILTITPSAKTRFRRWSGKVGLGLTLLRGNVNEIDSNINVDLKRRSVIDRIVLDYNANISRADERDVANNHRVKGHWDRFLTSRFFVKPVALEMYRDQFLNLDTRTTLGAGAGYQIYEKAKVKWEVSAGLAYQQTTFLEVGAGENQKPHTAAFSGATKFEYKWSKSVELDYDYTFYVANEASGRYNHNMVTTIETEWTTILDLDLTFVWDRTQLPQAGADGVVPKPDDFRTVVALSIEF